MTTTQCTLPLPPGFRVADILKFHQRDSLAFAERVEAGTLTKGMVWQGQPACLTVDFQAQQSLVKISLESELTAPRRKYPWGATISFAGFRPLDDRLPLLKITLGP